MLISIIKVSLLVYVGFGAWLYLAQRSFMYFPVPERSIPDLAFEEIASGDERIRVWVVGGGRERGVIYFGGNAEDVTFNADDFRRTLADRTVYLVDYRGYGGSTGKPSEQALFADALAVHDAVRGRHASVAVIGRSLGSAVAVYLASRRPVERLVLVTPPDSAVALARSLYPVYPVGLLLKDRYESVVHAADVTAPTLILTAAQDRVIPPRHSENLAAAFAPGLVQQAVVDGAGHNGLSGFAAYWRAIGRFLDADRRPPQD